MRVRVLWASLFISCLFGCMYEGQPSQGSWLARLSPPWSTGGGCQVEAAILEEVRPADYLADQLWRDVDESVFPPEQRLALEANGLRAGVLHGTCPEKLLRRLTDPTVCKDAKRLGCAWDQETSYTLRQGVAKARLSFHQNRDDYQMELQDAHFSIAIRLAPAANGKTLVALEPCVRHADATRRLARPDLRNQAWQLGDTQVPELRLSHSAWQVDIGPTDYLVVGALPARLNSFGLWAFTDAEKNVERVLIVRGVGRGEAPLPPATGPVPLAHQAAQVP